MPEAALKSIKQKFHNRKIIAPATLWANKMTFRVRAFKSLFSDTFEHDEKDDEAPLIWNVRKHFSSFFFLLLYFWGFAHWHFDKPIKLFEHNKTSSWNYHSDIDGFQLHLFPEFWRWWVLKCKRFAQELTCSKEIVLQQSCNELWFVKKCWNCTFKVNFLCRKSTEFFFWKNKKFIEEYKFRGPFFVKNIFF